MEQNDELKHWGIKGMKWGVRRYQNKDGSLTPAGRKRQMSDDARDAQALKKKKVSELSNAELRRLNERRNLERNYKQLNPGAIAKGAKVVGVTAAALGTIVGLEKNGLHLINSGRKIVTKANESFLRTPTGNKIASKAITAMGRMIK